MAPLGTGVMIAFVQSASRPPCDVGVLDRRHCESAPTVQTMMEAIVQGDVIGSRRPFAPTVATKNVRTRLATSREYR